MSREMTLAVCASCEWIYRLPPPGDENTTSENDPRACPKCGFGYYSAHRVYGQRAYTYARTQQPWLDKKLAAYTSRLTATIYHPVAPPPFAFNSTGVGLRAQGSDTVRYQLVHRPDGLTDAAWNKIASEITDLLNYP
jgi:hypothetical protein